LGKADDPAGAAAPGNVIVVVEGRATVAEDDGEELHPATAIPLVRPATVSASGAILRYPETWCLVLRCLIKTTLYSFDVTAVRQ
jgi:hypothetical protein